MSSEEYFRHLVEYAADAITIINADGSIRYSSPALQRLLGYVPEERRGHPIWDLIHPDDHGTARQAFDAIRSKPEAPISAQLRARAKNGEVRVLDFTARNLLHDPIVAGIVINTRDITDQKHAEVERGRAERELRESEERYRSIIDLSGEGVIIRDINDRITFVNQRMADLLDYPVSDLVGRPITYIASEDDKFAFHETGRPRTADGKEQFDFRARGRDGSEVWGIISARPMYDAQHNFIGTLTMFTDLTGRKQLEEQLRQAQKMEAVGRLAGGIAHDFNNLLTAIRGYAELLSAEIPPDHSLRGDLDEINRAAERATALTRQLLAFSRRQILQPRVLDVDVVVGEIEKLIRRLIGEDVELVTQLTAGGARVRADRGQIEQVLMNLAVNARDAMPDGGKLTIGTSLTTLDEEYVSRHPGAAPGTYACITISDTGSGMDARILSHVFEPFFTTKAVGKGTGLGLATVYGIVKQSGGYIAVESQIGAGTRFDFFLPRVLEAVEPVREVPAATTTTSTGAGQTVLLAEDEAAVRLLASRVLRKHGYHVLEAADGLEAVRVADAHDDVIHVLLTDVIMPRMGGRELVERLLPVRPGMRVAYMSGYTDDALLHRGVLSASEAVFLEKPFTPDSLLRKVREALGQERGSAE